MRLRALVVVAAALGITACGSSSSTTSSSTASSTTVTHTAAQSSSALASQLLNRYLSDLQRHDVADLQVLLSPAFQIQRADGSRTTKPEFLNNLTKLQSYKIRGMSVTADANVLVASFENEITGAVINGKPYNYAGYTPALMTFVNVGGHWQVLSFANFAKPA